MADYNSDDDETIVRDESDPYAHLGQRLAKKMLENVVKDRRESKQVILNLKPDFGVKATNQEYARWFNRWVVYRSVSDKATNLEHPPSMEMLERFLITVTNNANAAKISRGRETGVPSLNWLKRGIGAVIVGLRFRHSKWKPDVNAHLRFKAIMRVLLREGKLTRDPVRIKQWVTAKLTIQLANSYLEHALTTKTKSWDVVIMRLLSWVLQSAVDGRAGDVTMTKGYRTHFLRWEDIAVYVGESGTIDSVEFMVTLKNSKDDKDDPASDKDKPLRPLETPGYNACDAVNLLLIHGLRTGVFAGGSNLHDVLASGKANDGTILFKPEAKSRPVICQIEKSGSRLLLDRPATTPQMNKSLQDAGDAYGVQASLTTHDVKRGFARDYVYAPPMQGVARNDVAYAASHSLKSMGSGVTQSYVGQQIEAGYNHRFENQYDDKHQKYRLGFADQSYKEARLTTDEINAELREGEDQKDKKARQRAATRIKKRRRDAFYEQKGSSTKKKKSEPLLNKSMNISHVVHRAQTKEQPLTAEEDGDLSDEDSMFVGSAAVPTQYTEGAKDASEFYDADSVDMMFRQLNDSPDLSTSVPNTDTMIASILGDVDEASPEVLSMIEDVTTTPADLLRPAAEFIHIFSKIQAVGEHLREHREHPVGSGKFFWFIKCPNHEIGCQEELVGPQKVHNHYMTCPFNNPAYTPEPLLSCTFAGCSETFKKQTSLNAHIDSHTWTPRQCPDSASCQVEEVFATMWRFQTHRHKAHGRYNPTRCTFEGCSYAKVYDDYSSLKLHLKAQHGLVKAQDQNKYVYPSAEQADVGSAA